MEMIYGAACLDRVDLLDTDRNELWPKLKLKTPPKPSSAELGLSGLQPAALLLPPESKGLCFHREKV